VVTVGGARASNGPTIAAAGSGAPSASVSVAEPVGGAPMASGSASASAPSADAAPIDWKNAAEPPKDSPELQERARQLFDAIVKGEPEGADPFWFPRDPFVPLKDVKDPGKYWDQLHRTYGSDVRKFHRKRKNWDGATFVRFDLGSTPKWVPPGKEANKIGYFRSFHGKLRYRAGQGESEIDVHTVISWQGRWYITHLDNFKKKK
jgi:hypothetical protein